MFPQLDAATSIQPECIWLQLQDQSNRNEIVFRSMGSSGGSGLEQRTECGVSACEIQIVVYIYRAHRMTSLAFGNKTVHETIFVWSGCCAVCVCVQRAPANE